MREVRVKEMNVDRKIRLVYPARRVLSHAAQAFLDLVKAEQDLRYPRSFGFISGSKIPGVKIEVRPRDKYHD